MTWDDVETQQFLDVVVGQQQTPEGTWLGRDYG